MTRLDPATCGWTVLAVTLPLVAVACFTVAVRAALDVRRERAR